MHAQYPAKYTDAHQSIRTMIENDGTKLSMKLNGILFGGKDFDGFKPIGPVKSEDLAQFTLNHDELCNCHITCEIPIEIRWKSEREIANLIMDLSLGGPASNGGIIHEDLILTMTFQGRTYRTKPSRLFENGLLDLQTQMSNLYPATAKDETPYIKNCFTCAFSDYSPYGQGLFGYLFCFCTIKEKYSAVKSKDDLFEIWDENDRQVQEIDCCDEYEHRPPNTGYRG